MTARATWRGDDGNGRGLGRTGMRWYRRRITSLLFTADGETLVDAHGQGWSPSAAALLVNWYVDKSCRFVRWVDYNTWSGPGFACGQWQIALEAVSGAFDEATAHTKKAIDDARVTDLDEWLKADIDGTLLYRGDRGGIAIMPDDSVDEIRALRKRLRARRDSRRECRTCHCAFLPEPRNRVNCDRCLGDRKGRPSQKPLGGANVERHTGQEGRDGKKTGSEAIT